jgi:hypothetical protein
MVNIEYALLKDTQICPEHHKRSRLVVLLMIGLYDESVRIIDSTVYLSISSEEHTVFYCCNSNAYKCLTSAIVSQSDDAVSND